MKTKTFDPKTEKFVAIRTWSGGGYALGYSNESPEAADANIDANINRTVINECWGSRSTLEIWQRTEKTRGRHAKQVYKKLELVIA